MKLVNNISNKEFDNVCELVEKDYFKKFKINIRDNPVYFLNYNLSNSEFDIIINPRKKWRSIYRQRIHD